MTHRYSGPERRENPNTGQAFRIPAIVLIAAFVLGLLGLAGWANKLEQRKADKAEVVEIQNQLREIRSDIKELLRRGP